MNESRCSNERRRLGLAYPRTCMICGLGPCGNSTSTIPPAERPLEVGSEPVAWKPTHRHAKGGLYQKIGYATVQTTSGLHDMNDAVVYQAADGTLWVRSADEFDDGRFTALPPSPQTVAERREEPDKQPSQDVPSGDASRRDEATVSIGGNAELLEHMADTFGPSPDGALERDLAAARSTGSVFIRPRSPSAETDEDPYQELHIYEGDSALVVRYNGNKTLYGVQRPELLALFDAEVPSAEALPDEVAAWAEYAQNGNCRMTPDKAVEAARKKIYIVIWSEPHVYEPSSDRNVRAFADAAEATAAAQRMTDNAKTARRKYLAWVERCGYNYTSQQLNRMIAKCTALVGDPDYNPTDEIEYYVDTVEFIPAPPTAREGDDA